MAALVFDIDVEYQKVTQLTKELKGLEAELERVSQTGTPEEMEAITSRMAECRAELKQTTLAAAQLGVQVQQGISQRMAEATADVAEFSASVDKANTGVASLDFGTAQERVNALSMAIYDNEKKLASNVVTLNQYKQQAQAAFQQGDAEGLARIEQEMQSTIQTTLTLTSDTQRLRDALQEALNVQGSGVSTADAPKLFSEEDLALVDEYQQKIQDLKAEIATVGQQGGDTSALTQQLVQTEDALNAVNVKAAETASALGTDLGGRAAEAQQALIAANQAVAEQEAALATLESQVEAARQVVEELSNSETANEQEVQQAIATYEQLSQTLTQGQVALQGMQARQQAAQQTMQSVSQEIATHDNALVKMLGGYQNYQKVLSMLPGPLQKVIVGIQGADKAAWAFSANPIGAVLTAVAVAIGAVKLALKALMTWFNKTEEGQKAFAKVSGYVKGVLGQLTEIVEKFGKAIYEYARTAVKGAIMIKDAFNFGEGYFDRLRSDLDAFTDAAKDYGNSLVDIAKQTQKSFSNMGAAGREQASIETERKALSMQKSEFEIRQKELEAMQAEAQAIYRNSSKSKAERDKALADYKKYEDEIYQTQLGFAKKETELVERENTLTTNPEEAIKALNTAKAAEKEVEVEHKRRLAALARTEASLANTTVKGENTVAQARQKAVETAASTLLQLQQDNEKAELDLMEEGTQKRLAQIEYEYELEIQKTQELAKELADANKKAGTTDLNEYGLTAAQQSAKLESERLAEEKRRKAQREVYADEKQAMWDFYKEYGDYQQQKLAITEEYAKKIAEAQNIYDKQALQRKRDEELRELDNQSFDNTDWSGVFDNIDSSSQQALQTLKQRLVEAFEAGEVPAERLEAVMQKIDDIDAQLLKRQQSYGGLLGQAISLLKQHKQLKQQEEEKQERINKLQEDYNKTLSDIDELKKKIQEKIDEDGLDIEIDNATLKTSDGGDLIEALKDKGASDEEQGDISDMLNQVNSMQQAADSMGSALEGMSGAAEGASGALEGMSGAAGGGAAAIAAIDTIVHKINENVQSLGDLMDELGMDEKSDFAKGMNSFMESSQYATQGWEDLKSGNVVGVASSVLGSLRTLGEAIGNWTGSKLFGSSDRHLEEDLEKLSISNEDLKSSVDNLADVMSQNTTSLVDAKTLYDRQLESLEQQEKNTQESMSRSGAAYSNGFLGIGGTGSSNNKIKAAMNSSDWKRISEVVGRTISGASDFWTLTAEEMWNVQTYATDLYSKIKDAADDGYKDAAQYMDEYCDYYEELIELQNEYAEKVTGTSFDSLCDSFKSAIMDMSHSAEDFANDFEELMKEAVVNSIMSETYNKKLQDWYDEFRDSMESGGSLSKQEQEDLRQEYMDIVDQAQSEIKALYGTMGWDTSASSQEASGTAFTAMSEDTGEELNGRFTAMYESLLRLEGIGAVGQDSLTALSGSLDTVRS
ncbi:MAG: hypothetical protein LUI09_08375, partial [Prevotellaceae bacterium]|nr:hypothetical protein [Prevotellaceae bacterium]